MISCFRRRWFDLFLNFKRFIPIYDISNILIEDDWFYCCTLRWVFFCVILNEFVFVNVCDCLGAGEHKQRNIPSYNKLSKLACKAGISVLNSGGTALEAVKEAVIGNILLICLFI